MVHASHVIFGAYGFWLPNDPRGSRSDFVQKSGVSILACAILPDHLHLVIARHRYQVEQVVNLLKGAAASELVKQGIHPFLHLKHDDAALPKCFAQKSWKVFLDCNADIRRAIAYADNNPEKEGLRRQRWSFVSEFRGIGF